MQVKQGQYKHYKGNLYELIDTVKHSETEEDLVLYRPVDSKQLWVRPLEMFFEKVVIEGKEIDRFEYLGEK